MSQRMYFGHPVNVYDTELERFLLRKICEEFPDWAIENPNQKHHAEGYQHYKEIGRGMNYYFEEVLPYCDGGIFLPFRDGAWGAGVYGEARALSAQGCGIWQIDADGVISHASLLTHAHVLSVEETRARIRDAAGQPIPY